MTHTIAEVNHQNVTLKANATTLSFLFPIAIPISFTSIQLPPKGRNLMTPLATLPENCGESILGPASGTAYRHDHNFDVNSFW